MLRLINHQRLFRVDLATADHTTEGFVFDPEEKIQRRVKEVVVDPGKHLFEVVPNPRGPGRDKWLAFRSEDGALVGATEKEIERRIKNGDVERLESAAPHPHGINK